MICIYCKKVTDGKLYKTLKCLVFMMWINEDYASDIDVELQRYGRIVDYYIHSPSRIMPNKSYLGMIKERLVEISFFDERVSRELQGKSDEILDFFAKNLKFYGVD